MSAEEIVQGVLSETLVSHYLPPGYKFGSTGGNNNYKVPSPLPATKLVGKSFDGSKREIDIPEGAVMFIYSPYISARIDKTIAAIFFPRSVGQVTILSGGIIVLRRF